MGWERTPGGSLTVSGMTGLRRCSGCLREVVEEESDVEKVQLDMGVVEVVLAEVMRPPGTLGRKARSDGLGGQMGLSLF